MNLDHPYAYDLDIYGDFSLFQYINRTTTIFGRDVLADYLSKPVDLEKILLRQSSIKEAVKMIDWRQELQAHGLETEDDNGHIEKLKNWLEDRNYVLGDKLILLAKCLAPLLFIGGMVITAYYLPWQAYFLFLIPALIILRKYYEQVNATHNRTALVTDMLAKYARLLAQIEKKGF